MVDITQQDLLKNQGQHNLNQLSPMVERKNTHMMPSVTDMRKQSEKFRKGDFRANLDD